MGCDAVWSVLYRERFRNIYLSGLTLLIDYYADRELLQRAIAVAEEAASMEMWREGPQCRLIELYRQAGERTLALRRYRQFEASLKYALGVEPLPETKSLVADVLRD